MTESLFSATLAIARLLPAPAILVESAASADGAGTPNYNTLVDTTAWWVGPSTLPSDDFFNGGTIWFKDCNSTSLENKTTIITDYTSSSGTIQFTSLGAYQTKSGDTYAALPRFFPRFILRQAVNFALSITGGKDLQDSTLTVTSNTRAYNLPTGVAEVKRVEIVTSTSPYTYELMSRWEVINGQLVFGYDMDAFVGMSIRLTYRSYFTELTADGDSIYGGISINWIRWSGLAYCLRWRKGFETSKAVLESLADSIVQAEFEARKYRPVLEQRARDHQGSIWVK